MHSRGSFFTEGVWANIDKTKKITPACVVLDAGCRYTTGHFIYTSKISMRLQLNMKEHPGQPASNQNKPAFSQKKTIHA